ncbi:MAG: alcohol dehydrogenase, partial [Anaerolineales bacterium]
LSAASLFSGIALANAKLGAVHGFAGVLGGMFGAPHGAICATLLPQVTRVNLNALKQREPNNPALKRYQEIAQLVLGTGNEGALIDWLGELCEKMAIPRLREIGIMPTDFNQVIEKATHASSMKGNPIVLTNDELKMILDLAY